VNLHGLLLLLLFLLLGLSLGLSLSLSLLLLFLVGRLLGLGLGLGRFDLCLLGALLLLHHLLRRSLRALVLGCHGGWM
jgi:hypothetical protein